MADEPKPKPDETAPAEAPSATSISPAPTEVAGDAKAGGNSKPPPPDPSSKVQAEPLSDGTTPTVLATGASHRSVSKGKASINAVYRKADILTTALTFAGALVAGGIIIGGYLFFTRSKAATPTATPKVTQLDKSETDKLSAFFEGNSAGSSAQVLTISSSSLFKNRVAVDSDLKVVGGAQVSGTTALGDLTVDKTSTLGVTNIRGQLSVNGPLTLQSPALLNAGASLKGNLAVTGNGTFGGSISAGILNVRDLSVSGTFNIDGHLHVGGQQPTVSVGGGAGSGASATVSGNDTGGTATINTGHVPNNANLGGELIRITFRNAYSSVPTITITPNGRSAAILNPYILKTANWFIIGTSFDALSSTSYSFDYWVVQ